MRARSLLALAAVGLVLGACGFHPLYGQPGVAGGLAAVQVYAPEGRAGHLLREHLDDALASRPGAPADYRIDLAYSEVRYPRGLRVDNVATRYEYVLTADYTLRELPSMTPLKNGRARVTLTYDSADQPYASIAAQQDAQDRAAQEAARRIQLELAAWLAGQKG